MVDPRIGAALVMVGVAGVVGAQSVTPVVTAGSYYANANGQTQSSTGGPTGGQAAASGFAGFSCTVLASASAAVVRESLQLQASAGMFSPLGEQCTATMAAAAAVTARFRAEVPVAGVLDVRARGFAFLDVGDDRVAEITGFPVPARLSIPVVLDARGLVVRASVGQLIPTSFGVDGQLDLTFVPGAAGLATSASVCGTSAHGHRSVDAASGVEGVRLVAAPSTVTPHSYFVLGLDAAAVPVPPSGCRLATTPLLGVPAAVGASGEAVLAFALPPALPVATVYLQHLIGDQRPSGTHWGTGNRIALQLP